MRGPEPFAGRGGIRKAPLLLASVATPEEAKRALAGGADVLDIKEPREGSLGACPPRILRAIVALVDARFRRSRGGLADESVRPVPVSAALGDAPNLPGTLALAAAGAAACGVDILKVGLWGVRRESEAIDLVRAVVEASRTSAPSVRVVAAAYADADRIGALPPRSLPAVAEAAGADGCLIDTARKDGSTLFDHLEFKALRQIVEEAHRRGLVCGLAGSLSLHDVPILCEIGPDLVGARGALCEGGRQGVLLPDRLVAFRLALRGDAAAPRPPLST
jgi:uncharacterized protein (UPF0264 family)